MDDLQKQTVRAIVNVFETGKVRGDYGAVVVLKGDSGHLSYGRSQTTLMSGGLFDLLDRYCRQPGARFAAALQPELPRFKEKNVSLDTDANVHDLLKKAGREDPAMQATQDQFFTEKFLVPAFNAAETFGIALPLGQAVVYDSHVQGGWARLSKRIGAVNGRGEADWISTYIDMRRQWLQSLNPPLPATVYRMDSFRALFDQRNLSLSLPLSVHGVVITEDLLKSPTTARVLKLVKPYMRGDDVKALQQALAGKLAELRTALASPSLTITPDNVYGPFTDLLVKTWKSGKPSRKKTAWDRKPGSHWEFEGPPARIKLC